MKVTLILLTMTIFACNVDPSSNTNSKTIQSYTNAAEVRIRATNSDTDRDVCPYRSSWDLAMELRPIAEDAILISEADYSPQILDLDAEDENINLSYDLMESNVIKEVFKFYVKEGAFYPEEEAKFLKEYTFEEEPTVRFLTDLTYYNQGDDEYLIRSAKAFLGIKDTMQELKDVQAFKIGPQDDYGNLAEDQGLYAWLVIGISVDNRIVGFLLGDVAT